MLTTEEANSSPTSDALPVANAASDEHPVYGTYDEDDALFASMDLDPPTMPTATQAKRPPVEDMMDTSSLKRPKVEETTSEVPWKSAKGNVMPVSGSSAQLSPDAAHFQTLLKVFYQRLFPFKDVYRWLSYGNVQKHIFLNREFSFTLASETYIRFQSFKDGDELKNEILRMCPVKVDIGAVYNAKPKDKKAIRAGAFQPIERELVFDIDMTDYDEIRTCCSGGNICTKCWDFMTLSIKVIDRILRDDFGFRHILWVYSGRRGVHCWVSDERARKLTAEARRAIVSYMEVIKGGEGVSRKVSTRDPLHPSLRRAEDILLEHFGQTILEEMNVLGAQEQWSKVLQIIPDDGIRRTLDKEWTAKPKLSGEDKWDQLVAELERKTKPALSTLKRDIIFQYTYPRLDANVSIGLNHLLKSPFCVHPKTGRVCIPIDPAGCEGFNPMEAPELSTLIDELNAYEAKQRDQKDITEEASTNGDRKIPDYEKTSLKEHIEHFRRFVAGMDESVRDALRAKRAEEDRKLHF
ncbi:hypothetical protein HK104_004391 [Borealophlyctis nickersoniae]|nr:hypothetical protein HK104_004391 [Borealophlyctis nickersoniae]